MKLYLLRVTRIECETEDSKTFYLEPAHDGNLVYRAGQFLTLLIDINGKEVRRSYSLSSTPEVDHQLFITIKRIQNGIISRHLYYHLKEGDTIKALSPAGRFAIPEKKIDLHFFIAAGSGITPVFSLIKEVLYKHPDKKAILIYQNTNENKSIYRKQLILLKNTFTDNFILHEIFSQPYNNVSAPRRLNNFFLEELVKQYVDTRLVHFYICGPKEFMRMVQFTLRVLRYEDQQISKENFVVGFVPPPPFINDTSPKEVIIHFDNNTYILQVSYPQNILDAALQKKIHLPYSCRGGRCSTCTAKCIKGRVKMSINEVLSDNDLSQGLVLTCVGYAETDVELEYN